MSGAKFDLTYPISHFISCRDRPCGNGSTMLDWMIQANCRFIFCVLSLGSSLQSILSMNAPNRPIDLSKSYIIIFISNCVQPGILVDRATYKLINVFISSAIFSRVSRRFLCTQSSSRHEQMQISADILSCGLQEGKDVFAIIIINLRIHMYSVHKHAFIPSSAWNSTVSFSVITNWVTHSPSTVAIIHGTPCISSSTKIPAQSTQCPRYQTLFQSL